VNHEQRLQVISRAWGRKQDDVYYCFFPWIDREEQAQAGTRRAGFHDGPAFKWPTDRSKILAHMAVHEHHDLYWCPSLFEYPERKTEFATDEKSLWADLDEVDPRTLDDYPPTVAWETSPGRYQALWILNQGDIRGASWEGNENQQLTYAIGADESGWDTTQLLRIPGWRNHKLNYRDKKGNAPVGKLLWKNKRFYLPDEFSDLPKLERGDFTAEAVADNIEALDRSKVMAKWKLKIPKRIRELINAKETSGDRSDVLWDIERSLADIGCSVEEIVVIVRATAWNKYDGRADELKRLVQEASKAIRQRPADVTKELEEASEDKGSPVRWNDYLANIRPPQFLIKDVLARGKVGFIAGEPKAWKSWSAIDMAFSVAEGNRFLDFFDVVEPGPVLYIQEEDDPSTVKSRGDKIWRGKTIDRVVMDKDGSVHWVPGSDLEFNPAVDVYMQQGLTISEPEWQEWLSDTLRAGSGPNGVPYVLVLIDTLMMVAGDVEENRAQEMTTKIFRPLKMIAREHDVAVMVVHHLRKGGDDEKRGGQLMLGSVANHAWSENSIYLRLSKAGTIKMEVESKFFPGEDYRLNGLAKSRDWNPQVELWSAREQTNSEPRGGTQSRTKRNTSEMSPVLKVLAESGRLMSNQELQAATSRTYNAVWRILDRAVNAGKVEKDGNFYRWAD